MERDPGPEPARGALAKAFGALAFASWVGLAVLVVLLARANRALEAALARAVRAEEPAAASHRLTPGERFPPLFLCATDDGDVTSLRFDGSEGRTLLLVFAEACPVCPTAFLAWEELAPVALSAGVRVVALCLDAGEGEVAGPAGVTVFAPGSLATLPLDELRTLPSMLLLDAFGTVEWAHYGTPAPAHLEELGARF